jgi:hypothetical protein
MRKMFSEMILELSFPEAARSAALGNSRRHAYSSNVEL